MRRRRTTERVAANISQAIVASDTDIPTIARAVGMDNFALESRLDSESELSLEELVRVGGALHLHPSELLAGVA